MIDTCPLRNSRVFRRMVWGFVEEALERPADRNNGRLTFTRRFRVGNDDRHTPVARIRRLPLSGAALGRSGSGR